MSNHQAKYKEKNKAKVLCRDLFNNAVRAGTLIKPLCCTRCGDTGPIEGHHDDYLKPLDVSWLCVDCHKREHGKYDPETQQIKAN